MSNIVQVIRTFVKKISNVFVIKVLIRRFPFFFNEWNLKIIFYIVKLIAFIWLFNYWIDLLAFFTLNWLSLENVLNNKISISVEKREYEKFNYYLTLLTFYFKLKLPIGLSLVYLFKINCYLHIIILDFINADFKELALILVEIFSALTNFFFIKVYENIYDVFFSLIIIHIIILILFSLKQINYKLTSFTLTILLVFLWSLVVLFIFNKTNFTLDYSLNIKNVFIIIPTFNIKIDFLSLVFLFTIYTISIFVHIYQHVYLELEPRKDIFLIGLNCFILSMVLLVIASNWILFFLAWEALGISSFFLIGFFKQKVSAWKSAKKAFFFNKISDLLLLVSLGFTLKLNESLLINSNLTFNQNYNIITFCLTLMAFLKSAQFIFYFWLPDSMEAPIPASALIHSATLVSAGIYIVLRFNLFENQFLPYQIFIHVVIFSTMIVATLLASMQTDIKKLLAYSTIANCSFIFFLILIKLHQFALLYFILHGVLKSGCFLVAGVIILIQKHYQDMNKWVMCSVYDKLLLLFLSMSTLTLSGSPLIIMYNLKSSVYLMYSENNYLYWLTHVTLLLYTISSYIYGLKIFYLFLNKKTKPIFINFNYTRNNILPKIILILILYMCLILLLTFVCLYKQITFNIISYNLIVIVFALIISLILLNITIKWPDYVFWISLLNIFTIFWVFF